MSLSWYQCRKCSATLKKDSSPNSSGCPEGSNHDWRRLAEVGDTNYQCKRCGTLIQTKSTPSSSGCPDGNNNHDWRRL
jgi:DNA-directed RNA polymerase subunit RPC12/RpoP